MARYKIPQQLQESAKQRVGQYGFVKGANGQRESEVYVKARRAYRTLSTLLGDKEHFFGPR